MVKYKKRPKTGCKFSLDPGSEMSSGRIDDQPVDPAKPPPCRSSVDPAKPPPCRSSVYFSDVKKKVLVQGANYFLATIMKAVCLIAACYLAVAHSFYPPPPPSGGNIGKEPLLYPEIQKRTSFRYYYVTHDGKAYNYKPSAPSIPIAATEGVPDDAMRKAADIVSHMTKNSPDEVFSALTGFLGVGLFTAEEGLSVYPEHARYADRPECYGRCDGGCADTCMANGQKWNKMAGMTIGRTVVLDDNVMCSAEDPYQHTENILNHEFAHLVEEALPKAWHDKLEAAYRNAYANRLWTLGTYAMQSAREYFGEATEAWFYASMRTDVTGGLNMCGTRQVCKSEKDVRDYIQQHDPQLFEVLSYAYTNGRPELEGGIGPCAKEFYEAIIGDN